VLPLTAKLAEVDSGAYLQIMGEVNRPDQFDPYDDRPRHGTNR
jgi:hypothetical protein